MKAGGPPGNSSTKNNDTTRPIAEKTTTAVKSGLPAAIEIATGDLALSSSAIGDAGEHS
jgi:hypothetical protein